jgi:hypothetical protein
MYHLNGWALTGSWKDNPHNDTLAEEGKITLLFGHYGEVTCNFSRWQPQSPNEWMMGVLPTLSPLRDPLIGIIRAWHREKDLYPFDFIMDNYVHIAKRGRTLGVNFWRMDPFDKEGFLNAVIAVGLSIPDEWVNNLTPDVKINDTPGECDLRIDYANGDIEAIAKKLPLPWRRLKENEPVLKPFLKSCGFKDLMWWNK